MALSVTVELTEQDIKQAIEDYLASNNISTENKHVGVEIIAGRKGTGCRASVSISELSKEVPVEGTEEEEDTRGELDLSTAPEPEEETPSSIGGTETGVLFDVANAPEGS